MRLKNYPRVVITGLSGNSGKTVVACGLLSALKERGINVSAFKKGPDYIDSAWLSISSGKSARNLDSYLMDNSVVLRSFLKNASDDDANIIEGNRGLFDGVNSNGSYSTAELAKSLKTPVIIVQDVSKVTRTAAASILGCMKMDPNLDIAGVILNRVAGERHTKVAKESIEEITGIPVLGAIPKLPSKFILPSRHLGLITPEEYDENKRIIYDLGEVIKEYVDVEKIERIINDVPKLDSNKSESDFENNSSLDRKVKIGYFQDQAFTFYYPENLEALSNEGAELVPYSAFKDKELGDIDAFYIGGGFPETNLTNLTLNRDLLVSVKDHVEDGLPIYAECGGLIYLANSIKWNEELFNLSNVLPLNIEMFKKPQGHGYCEAVVDKENPFYELGTKIKGHEFHYSKIIDQNTNIESAFSVKKGIGCFNKRDGLVYKNVFATYFHVHALGTPEWANGMIKSAIKYKNSKLIPA